MDDVRIVSTFAMIASGIFLLFAGLCWISPGMLKLILRLYHTGLMDKKEEFSKKGFYNPVKYGSITEGLSGVG